jgi:intracellular septation protein A
MKERQTIMRIWSYKRPFQHKGVDYEVNFSFTFSTCTSQVYCDGSLINERTCSFSSGFKVIEHKLKANSQSSELSVSVGYYSWCSIGIEVRENNELIYASHPNEDIHFAEKKIGSIESKTSTIDTGNKEQRHQKWQQNKYSIFADIGLGAAFFVVAKVTSDLTIAAFTGVILGLALVVIQRFVKVDLLGGFAVFGTVMLLISALFSLAFQSEHLLQHKGTFIGLLGASVFLADGVFRNGRYFGCRFDRYLSSPVKHQNFVIGLGIISACMSGFNYGVATYLSEDVWLTYNTFLDMPIYLILFIILTKITEKKHPKVGDCEV